MTGSFSVIGDIKFVIMHGKPFKLTPGDSAARAKTRGISNGNRGQIKGFSVALLFAPVTVRAFILDYRQLNFNTKIT